MPQDAEHRFLRGSVSLWEGVTDHASSLMRGTAIGLWHWKEIHHSVTKTLDEMKCPTQSTGSPTLLPAARSLINQYFVWRQSISSSDLIVTVVGVFNPSLMPRD
jgi:hypothetical protein